MRLRWFVCAAVLFALAADLATPRGRMRALLTLVARSWEARVAIEGASMEPTLAAGDWLLVDPDAYARRPPMAGELVLAPDPRTDDLLLIKRVDAIDPDGRLRMAGDDPDHSTDSRAFGSIDRASVIGRPWFRYWPMGRVGRIR
jgi:nickel-type superoxide dismutase maturation protease